MRHRGWTECATRYARPFHRMIVGRIHFQVPLLSDRIARAFAPRIEKSAGFDEAAEPMGMSGGPARLTEAAARLARADLALSQPTSSGL